MKLEVPHRKCQFWAAMSLKSFTVFDVEGAILSLRRSLFRSSRWWAHARPQPPLPPRCALTGGWPEIVAAAAAAAAVVVVVTASVAAGFHSTLWAAVRLQTDTRTGLNFCYGDHRQHQQSVFRGFGHADRRPFSSPVLLPVLSGPSLKVSVRFLWQLSVRRERGMSGLLLLPCCCPARLGQLQPFLPLKLQDCLSVRCVNLLKWVVLLTRWPEQRQVSLRPTVDRWARWPSWTWRGYFTLCSCWKTK